MPPEVVNGEDEDHNTRKRIEETVGDAERAFQNYKHPIRMSQKALNIAGAAVDTVQDKMEVVSDGINTLIDGLPALLKALDEVARLHPFIGVAVGAFRTVLELELKHHYNDTKIAVLFVEMRNMMEGLLRLRGIKDPESVGPDGLTIQACMQELVRRTAEDIKTCGNTCDTYAKQNLIVKIIKGSVWDSTLKGFIDLFANRRKEFTFALSIHVNIGVDHSNRRLKEIDAKIDMVLDFFSKVMSPEQQELAALVQKKGGPAAVMADNGALKELLKFRPATATGQAKRANGRDGAEHSHQDGDELATVKQELFDSPELAIKKNLEVFERKFEIQQMQLAEEVRRMVHHEGDRVIEAVTSGPHDRIIEPDIHEIWKDMRWPGHVKARHFVLALCAYYRRDSEKKREPSHPDVVVSRVADQDEWTFKEWINVNRLQAISEVFNNDASKVITIAEVNHFTTSRPRLWSLPHWLAYWAIGWEMAATKYRDMIDDICAKMFAIRSRVHPANRDAVDQYLQIVWQKIYTLTSSLVGTSRDDSLQEHFQDYIEAEEQRLRETLETVQYDIDSMETLLFVTGPDRIEKHLFPLLWLLLHHDFEIFRLCRYTVIHKDELWQSANTILRVFEAVTQRHDHLEVLFKQQKLDPGPQFKAIAGKLFSLWHDPKKFWSFNNLRMLEFPEVENDDSKEDQDVDVSKLLNYPRPLAPDDLYAPWVEDSIAANDLAADEAIHLVLGRWNGIQISDGSEVIPPMIMFYVHASMDPKTYEASSIGANGIEYNIFGSYTTKDNGTIEYAFTQTYVTRIPETYWTGTLSDDGERLSGKWGNKLGEQLNTFVCMRVLPEIFVDRPHPKEFAEHRVKALWKYALTVVHNQVRRRLFSWSYIKERRDVRKEYLDLHWQLKDLKGLKPTIGDLERLSELTRRSTLDDVRRFYLLHDYRQRAASESMGNAHLGLTCKYCWRGIYGTRMVCMECSSRFTFDFCDQPACVGCTIRTHDDISSPHFPTHDFVKIRTPILHHRGIGKVLRNAKTGLERAKNLMEEVEDQKRRREFMKNDTGGGSGPHGGDNTKPLTCLICHSPVGQPYLYCIDCPSPEDPNSEPFICWQCDEREARGFSHGKHHLATHNLVCCMEAQKGELKPEQNRRAQGVDPLGGDRLEGITSDMAGLKSQMEVLTSGMGRIEKLLQSLSHVPASDRCQDVYWMSDSLS